MAVASGDGLRAVRLPRLGDASVGEESRNPRLGELLFRLGDRRIIFRKKPFLPSDFSEDDGVLPLAGVLPRVVFVDDLDFLPNGDGVFAAFRAALFGAVRCGVVGGLDLFILAGGALFSFGVSCDDVVEADATGMMGDFITKVVGSSTISVDS